MVCQEVQQGVVFCSLLKQSDDEEASPSANLKACVII